MIWVWICTENAKSVIQKQILELGPVLSYMLELWQKTS